MQDKITCEVYGSDGSFSVMHDGDDVLVVVPTEHFNRERHGDLQQYVINAVARAIGAEPHETPGTEALAKSFAREAA